MKYFASMAALLVLLATSAAQAGVIANTSITASTTLIERPSLVPGDTWAVEELVDGIISDAYPFFGFVSTSTSGTIHLTLDGLYDLNEFRLWNDLNVLDEGVRTFRLDFFDENSSLLSSTGVFTAVSQLAVQVYGFGTVAGVKSVDLVILSSNLQIEIREVGLSGTPVAVPAPAGLGVLLLGLVIMRLNRRPALA